MNIINKNSDKNIINNLTSNGINPLLSNLFASRGIKTINELNYSLKNLLNPNDFKDINKATNLLVNAIFSNKRICIVADYDCDGATACAVAIRGLKLLGVKPENIGYIVPDRIKDGYGLNPNISQKVFNQNYDILITVDNGISAFEGIDKANELGLITIITDHHLAGEKIPDAEAIINPNQSNCKFKSKSIAGVGVIFYLLLALRTKLREKNIFNLDNQPRLNSLLPLVALGTIADVVKLDFNNRILVHEGIKLIKNNKMPVGIKVLFEFTKKDYQNVTTSDFGFILGPRINASGRLENISTGIECLLTDNYNQALNLAKQLFNINEERKNIQSEMIENIEQAEEFFNNSDYNLIKKDLNIGISLFNKNFHEGVIGIVASRLKENLNRPCFIFAQSKLNSSELKGSGRSINGFHIRDALDLIDKKYPYLILRFGGHSMAAGCTILKENFKQFKLAFNEVANELLNEEILKINIVTDGELKSEFLDIKTIELLNNQIWGQGFEFPVFNQEMEIINQRVLKDKHLKLYLKYENQYIDAIYFNNNKLIENKTANFIFKPEINEWNNQKTIQLIIENVLNY